MAIKEKTKIGLDQINFLPLGAVSKGEDEEVIVNNLDLVKEPKKEVEELKEEIEESSNKEVIENEEIDEEIDEEVDEEVDEETDEESIFSLALNGKEIDFSDESFKGINFKDPDTEDLSKFIDIVSEKLSETKLNKIFNEIPEVKGIMEFINNGGDPRQYIETMYPQFDYSKVDFDTQISENESAQEQIIRNQLQANQLEEEEINEIIEDYRAGGILEKQARRSLKTLSKMQEEYKHEMLEKQKLYFNEREEKAIQERKKIEETIEKSPSILGLKLPKTDKEDLKTYLFKPVNNEGYSQAYIDGNQMTEEERVAIAYLKMKNFDFESLVGNEAESRNAQKLLKTIKKTKSDKLTKKNANGYNTYGKIQDIKPIF